METEQVSVPIQNLKEGERRIQRWIDPSFQRRYAFLLISIVLFVGCILIGTFWFHATQVLSTLASANLVQTTIFKLVEKQMHYLLCSVIVVVSLFSVFVFLMGITLSHRIVGPIFAIKRSLERIGSGDYQGARISLRSDDEFKDVADLINKTIDQLEKK